MIARGVEPGAPTCTLARLAQHKEKNVATVVSLTTLNEYVGKNKQKKMIPPLVEWII